MCNFSGTPTEPQLDFFMHSTNLQNKFFLLFLSIVTVGFLAILWPFHGSVFWALVLAILFKPLHKKIMRRMPLRKNLATLCTLGVCFIIVILPLIFVSASLIQEASTIYIKIKSGELNFGDYFHKIMAAMPSSITYLLNKFGISSLVGLQNKLSSIATQASQLIAGKIFNLGQDALDFLIGFGIMLYLLFFFLRDGWSLAKRIGHALPITEEYKIQLAKKFTTVIRATVKGNVVVALVQGALGSFILGVLGIQGTILWGVLMAFLSLLPAVGAGLIWAPVAIYFFATGATIKAIILTSFGIGVIGLVDNILRPILVGKDTKMPDYIVLISTLGGMSLFGLTGFVIGPVIAALFIACWYLFAPEKQQEQ